MEDRNVEQIHKESSRQCLKNYHPVSLLLTCDKILEHLIFNEMFSFFKTTDLISENKSGIKPKDSCVDQILSIAHIEIFRW